MEHILIRNNGTWFAGRIQTDLVTEYMRILCRILHENRPYEQCEKLGLYSGYAVVQLFLVAAQQCSYNSLIFLH